MKIVEVKTLIIPEIKVIRFIRNRDNRGYFTDIDWSICDKRLKNEFDVIAQNPLITEKDENGFSLYSWRAEKNSDYFVYDKLK